MLGLLKLEREETSVQQKNGLSYEQELIFFTHWWELRGLHEKFKIGQTCEDQPKVRESAWRK